MTKNNTVGSNEILSGLWLQGRCKSSEAAGEHCNKLLCLAFHFSSRDISLSFTNNADSKTQMWKHDSNKTTMSRFVCSLFLENTMIFWLWWRLCSSKYLVTKLKLRREGRA